jgi:hypothetical protein
MPVSLLLHLLHTHTLLPLNLVSYLRYALA